MIVVTWKIINGKKTNEKCPMKLRHELPWQYHEYLSTDRTICHTDSPVAADGGTGQPKMPTCEHIDKELEHWQLPARDQKRLWDEVFGNEQMQNFDMISNKNIMFKPERIISYLFLMTNRDTLNRDFGQIFFPPPPEFKDTKKLNII